MGASPGQERLEKKEKDRLKAAALEEERAPPTRLGWLSASCFKPPHPAGTLAADGVALPRSDGRRPGGHGTDAIGPGADFFACVQEERRFAIESEAIRVAAEEEARKLLANLQVDR